ncbi:uncharacterized protein LOC129887992 [Solanum dulcamara]|uniref:uncharacterized protein LOC129887992 n=1 Tax=Solanum dulcamara TaxID=45834 RepID=UPI002484E25D|nr:uncharacterized protein LOC129887992 [Solanum dulcamara]
MVSPYLEDLLSKKSSVRERALEILVEEFETHVRYELAENHFFTMVYQCKNCLKRGSALEIDLALHLIALVVLTLGAGDNAHEVYEDSLVFLPRLLIKSKLSLAINVIECLSIVTIVAARDFAETEISMEIIWKFMNQESKLPSSVIAAAISNWALLLSATDRWSISHQLWKGLIPYLLKQLEEDDDEHVIVASIEALALIFENGSLQKFSFLKGKYSSTKSMKDGIMEQLKRVCNGTKQNTSKILEDDYDKTSTLTLGRSRITISTWSQLKQVNYIRRFLGYGFTNHMMENEHLQNVFRFAPATTECSVDSDDFELNKPEFEKVCFRVFIPEVRSRKCAKRIHMSPSSLLNKGKTKLRNKYRSFAEETKAGYIVDEELD